MISLAALINATAYGMFGGHVSGQLLALTCLGIMLVEVAIGLTVLVAVFRRQEIGSSILQADLLPDVPTEPTDLKPIFPAAHDNAQRYLIAVTVGIAITGVILIARSGSNA